MSLRQVAYSFPTPATGVSIIGPIEVPGNFIFLYLEVPTMSAGYSAASTPIYIQASVDNSIFRRFSNPENNTSVVGVNDFTIASATSQRHILINQFAMRYMQLEISGTVTTPANLSAFRLVAVSNQ